MQIREYSLPAGWYPRDPKEAASFLKPFSDKSGSAKAAICPHAGWYYSGKIAARGVSSLEKDCDTIAVIGGHLPASSSVLFAMEDAVRTPFGNFFIDSELRAELFKKLNGAQDKYRDNTVEVLLPMVHHFFPDKKLLWLRLPASLDSFEAGKKIYEAAQELGKKINVIGSTDLTHYGANYGFSPRGKGSAALKWVKEVNDAGFIKAVEEGNPSLALKRAESDFSSCSAGAVLGAMGYASSCGNGGAKLLEYGTSADIDNAGEIPDSFVGYAAFSFG